MQCDPNLSIFFLIYSSIICEHLPWLCVWLNAAVASGVASFTGWFHFPFQKESWIIGWLYCWLFEHLHTVFHSGCAPIIPPTIHKYPLSLRLPQHVPLVFSITVILTGVSWNLTVVLIWQLKMLNTFSYTVAIWISFEKCLFNSSAHVFNWVICFMYTFIYFPIELSEHLTYFIYWLFINTWLANIPPSASLPVQKVFSLMKSKLSAFSFACTFGFPSKICHCTDQCQEAFSKWKGKQGRREGENKEGTKNKRKEKIERFCK